MAWNLLSGLVGGGVKDAGEGVKSVLEGVSSFATGLRSAITGEMPPEKRAELEAKAAQIDAVVATAQQKVNEIEANHASLFVAGWRPAVGWICAAAILYHFVAHALITWAMLIWAPDIEAPPQLSLGELMPVLIGMLGLVGARSYEKKHEVNDRH